MVPPPDHMIRPLANGDEPQVLAIYNHYITQSAATFDLQPFDLTSRQPWYAQFDGARHICLVAEQDGQICGYANSSRLRPKAAYAPSVEVSVYIAAGHHGKGLGRALYTALFEHLASQDVHRCYAAITLPNERSVALHEAFGFTVVGRFSEVGFKFNRYWDVLWMEQRGPGLTRTSG